MIRPARNKDEVVQRLLSSQKELALFGVTSIGLFGSFLTGRQTPRSDIDILVSFAPDQHTFDNFMDLSFFLEDLLGRKIELVTPESLSPYIGPRILSEVERVPVFA